MKQILLALVLASAATAAALATPVAVIRGTISDPINHHVVRGAQIEVNGEGAVLRTLTNDRGEFSVVGIPPGPIGVTISADGYSTVTVATCVVPSETRGMPLFIVPQLTTISNSAAAQVYYDRANLHDNAIASASDFELTSDQYGVGLCSQ